MAAKKLEVIFGTIYVLTKTKDLRGKPDSGGKPFQSCTEDHVERNFEYNKCWEEDLFSSSILNVQAYELIYTLSKQHYTDFPPSSILSLDLVLWHWQY